MTNRPDNASLPENITTQIRAFEARLRRFETLYTVCGALAGLAAAFALLFVSDRFWDTPVVARALLTATGMVCAGWFTLFWMRRWGWAHRSRRQLAVLIQKRHARLGDRLQSAVELAEHPDESFSPALVRAAIRQVGEESEKYDFAQAVETRRPRRWLALAGVLTAAVLLPLALYPSAWKNALQRWINPFGDVERFTFVKLEDIPSPFVVPHGDPFVLACRVSADSESRPDSAFARFSGQPKVAADIRGADVVFQMPGQTAESDLFLRVGDATRTVRVVPAHRPELVGLRAHVRLPDYLGQEVREQEIQSRTLAVVEGSRVKVEAETRRELKSARWEGEGTVAVAVNGSKASTPEFSADQGGEVAFTWVDRLNLTPSDPVRLSLDTLPDAPPRVEARGAHRNIVILEEEVATLPLAAEDDFGLSQFAVNWRAEHQVSKDAPPTEVAAKTVSLAEGGPRAAELEAEFKFAPVAEGVEEGSTVFVKAVANDYKPGRVPVDSPEYRIFILSKIDHANTVRERMEALMNKIEEAARTEDEQSQENRSLAMKNDEQLATPEAAEQLKANAKAEERNAEQVKRMAETARELMKEAMRNKDIAEQTVGQLSEMSDQLQSVSEGKMSEAKESLQQAASSPQGRQEKASEASDQQKEAAKELQEMAKKMNKNIENMLAMNFINRLRKAASEEESVGGGSKTMLVELLGVTSNQLSQVQAKNIDSLAQRQEGNTTQAGYIRDDLSGYFNRTRKEVYNTIHQEMEKEQMPESLEVLGRNIRSVTLGRVVRDAGTWKTHFTRWADLLEEENKDDQESGEGECPDPEEIDMETMIALMRARVREEALREQTRATEAIRLQQAHPKASRKIAVGQTDLAHDMDVLEKKVKSEKLKPLIIKVGGEMMNAGARLNQADTGSDTIAIQTEIIELLSEIMKQSKCSKPSASMMAGMGMMPGRNPGGRPGDLDADPSGGDALASKHGPGRPDQASGVNPADFPEEFREALESYYQGMEAP